MAKPDAEEMARAWTKDVETRGVWIDPDEFPSLIALLREYGRAEREAHEKARAEIRKGSLARVERDEARIAALEGALRVARDAIAAAPDDTWGTSSAGSDEWPVSAEILAKIAEALLSPTRPTQPEPEIVDNIIGHARIYCLYCSSQSPNAHRIGCERPTQEEKP